MNYVYFPHAEETGGNSHTVMPGTGKTDFDAAYPLGKSKHAYSWSFERTQSITSVAAVNYVRSQLIAAACSDKSLHVLDAATGLEMWTVPNAAGGRAAHSIAFPNVSSSNAQLPPESFNLLVAASTDGGGLLSLWDLRSGTIARTFRGHTNRTERCMPTFSPCMRYVAVGSEGNCGAAAIYDLKGGHGPAVRLGKTSSGAVHKDGPVTDVQFNPLYPQIATASLSGNLRFYTEPR